MGNCAISFNCGTDYNTSLELHEDYITIVQRDSSECEDLISVPLVYVDKFVAALSQVASYDTCDSNRILPGIEIRKATLSSNAIIITKATKYNYGVDVVVVARKSVNDLIKAFNELTGKNVPEGTLNRSEGIYNHVNTLNGNAGTENITLSLDQLTTIQIAMENLYTECSCEEHGTQYVDHLKEILGAIAAIKLNWSSDERYQSIFQPVLLSLPGLSDASRYLHCTEENPDV